ncbi:hypothetical protein SRRS_39660 [Sporomusa rhizae]|uniref:GNAT family N-acetyltransferase n=1 Tax=Sporomusa rhizae TaxID=357999 RepID=UPI00352B6A08
MILKEATVENIDLLFIWVNDKSVRESAFNSKVIAYQEHKDWFYKKLNSSNCKIYIGYVNDYPIGQVRIDIEEDIAIIDYSVDRRYRGKGYGVLLLEALANKVKNFDRKIDKLIGNVKYSNLSSQRTFDKAGYNRQNQKESIFFYKKIETA